MDFIHFLEIREPLNYLALELAELLKLFMLKLLQSCKLVGFLKLQLKIVHALALCISVILLPLSFQLLEIVIERVTDLVVIIKLAYKSLDIPGEQRGKIGLLLLDEVEFGNNHSLLQDVVLREFGLSLGAGGDRLADRVKLTLLCLELRIHVFHLGKSFVIIIALAKNRISLQGLIVLCH